MQYCNMLADKVNELNDELQGIKRKFNEVKK